MTATKQRIIRIGIDGGDFNLTDSYKSGIQRLVGSFAKSINFISTPNLQWFYYYFGSKSNHFESDKIKTKKLNTKLFSSLFLPFTILFDRINIYMGFSGILPPFLRFFSKKSIIFIHDFGFYKNPPLYQDSIRMKWQSEYAIYGADKVIVFSDHIKKQLFEYYPKIKHEKVIRIYPGVDHLPKIEASVKKETYFLYVGVIKPVKNIEVLLSIFDEFIKKTKKESIKLILIGSKEQKYFQSLLTNKFYINNKKRIEFLENISDKELVFYYQNSLALLNYSLEEGFCYPVLEGLYERANVIVNNIPLYEEFAFYFNNLYISKNKNDFIEQMIRVSDEKKVPVRKINHPFYWNKFTEEVLKVIYQTI